MSTTAAERKKRQRESTAQWLREHEGISLDALGTALKKGLVKLVWLVERPERKKKRNKVREK